MAEGKKTNIALIIGVAINAILVIFMGYTFYTTIPSSTDILTLPNVTVPKVVDPKVQSIIDSLNKVEPLPITIDPSEIGKNNPYSQ